MRAPSCRCVVFMRAQEAHDFLGNRVLQGCGERHAVKLQWWTDSSKGSTDTLSKLALAFVGLCISQATKLLGCGLAAGKTLASKICTPVCPERLKAAAGSPSGRIERQFWAQRILSPSARLSPKATSTRCNVARGRLLLAAQRTTALLCKRDANAPTNLVTWSGLHCLFS